MRHIKISSLSEQKKFEEIGEIVEKGGVITYPTDTIYGFGCSPFCLDAVERIHEIKGRPDKSPLLILLDHATRLEQWCDNTPGIANKYISAWPAPLTIILPIKGTVSEKLTRGLDSLGFRVPQSTFIRQIVTACGGSITSTSVNRSGRPPLHDPEEIIAEFSSEIDLAADSGILPNSAPSTIISCLEAEVKLLRQGTWQE